MAAIITNMTITSDTIGTHVDAHRDAPDVPHTAAMTDSEADQLFAEGMALLDKGDHLGASEKVWKAAVTAMLTYSNARGWKPQDWHLHRMLMDIGKFRCEELGIPYIGTPDDPDPVMGAFAAADMLEAHIAHEGHFMSPDSVRRTIDDTRPLLDYFRLD